MVHESEAESPLLLHDPLPFTPWSMGFQFTLKTGDPETILVLPDGWHQWMVRRQEVGSGEGGSLPEEFLRLGVPAGLNPTLMRAVLIHGAGPLGVHVMDAPAARALLDLDPLHLQPDGTPLHVGEAPLTATKGHQDRRDDEPRFKEGKILLLEHGA
jgi:hypothetical protein